MTNTNFSQTQNELILTLVSQREALLSQLDAAKEQYRIACEAFGNASKQAGQCDKMICAIQTAVEALGED